MAMLSLVYATENIGNKRNKYINWTLPKCKFLCKIPLNNKREKVTLQNGIQVFANS